MYSLVGAGDGSREAMIDEIVVLGVKSPTGKAFLNSDRTDTISYPSGDFPLWK